LGPVGNGVGREIGVRDSVMTSLLDQKVTETIPFGKHRGKPIEALRGDPQYLEWLMGQDWFREKYQTIYQLVVNNFGEPSETPAQNRITVRFLDEEFCRAFFTALGVDWVNDPGKIIEASITAQRKHLAKLEKELAEKELAEKEWVEKWKPAYDYYAGEKEAIEKAKKRLEQLASIQRAPEIKYGAEFEYKGWTVHADVCLRDPHPNEYSLTSDDALVKIRPSLGDDFPTILRQMKAGVDKFYEYRAVLLIGEYAGAGATLDQVRKMFDGAGFKLITLEEVEGCA
jgi:hypothetical protein